MIISASRRTDMPAFYSRWFFNRLKEGYVMVRNPMNSGQVSRITLSPEAVDCIVFWTKDPGSMLDRLDLLEPYRYYFLFTLTAYGSELEKNVPPAEKVIDRFISLSKRIGKERVTWRYDPILSTDQMDARWHYRNFEDISAALRGYTEKCIVSFIDLYKKCRRNLRDFNVRELEPHEMRELAQSLARICRENDIRMETCAEEIDLSDLGIGHSKCIDDSLIERIIGKEIVVSKDHHQRKACGCVESIDIGAYNTCNHQCLYCYANSGREAVASNLARHDHRSPLLTGNLTDKDRITQRESVSLIKNQKNLFDPGS